VQHPHPPIIVGGEGPRVLDRVLDYGDEWGPNAEDGLEGRVRELQGRATDLGRAPTPVTAFHVRPDLATLRSYAAAGVTRCVFSLPSAGEDAVRAVLDELGRLVEAYHAEQ
jgi:alkanesulfonate monooxygenase SsuD/methylene tetrahydromethanopterin reductase-like flavin-dependent oxidoreductase (luciferase family)